VVAGSHLFLSNGTEVLAWALTDPHDPRPVGQLELPDYIQAGGRMTFSAWGDRLLIAQDLGGVTVMEVVEVTVVQAAR
jgi:hypothetical protein